MESRCDINRKLAAEFATAARIYGEIVVKLAVSGKSHDDYVRFCKMAQEAQNRSASAFIAYQEHVDLHRCYKGETDVLAKSQGAI